MRSRPAEEFDVEHVGDDDEQHVEMDVGLGVVDLKTEEVREKWEIKGETWGEGRWDAFVQTN